MSDDIHVNPDELEKFVRELARFNQDLSANILRLKGQFNHLGETWRDRQQQQFAQEFEQTIHTLHQFIELSERQIPALQKKARAAREFQNR